MADLVFEIKVSKFDKKKCFPRCVKCNTVDMTISTNEDIVFIVKFGTLNCHEEVCLFLSGAAAALFMTSDAIVKCYVPSRRRKDLPFKYYWVLNTPMALAVLHLTRRKEGEWDGELHLQIGVVRAA